MKSQIELQPAFLLHARPFRDSSMIIDFLTRDFGRLSAIAQGIRRPKAKNKGLLQPFVPLLISVAGKSELKSLRTIELRSDLLVLKSNALFSGLYLNELMVRLIHGQEVEAGLFQAYESVLRALGQNLDLEPLLRIFEIGLLESLGYGINFLHEGLSGDVIDEGGWYYFEPETGFNFVHDSGKTDMSAYFLGAQLIRIENQDYTTKQTRLTAKRLLREVLGFHLGSKPLQSRQLFAQT